MEIFESKLLLVKVGAICFDRGKKRADSMRFWVGIVCLLLSACDGLERSEQEKLKLANAEGEFIVRSHGELAYLIPPLKYRARSQYPWEKNYVGNFPKITKEFFRCRGKSTNALRLFVTEGGEEVHLFDCSGSVHHSLPIVGGKEFIYPVLIEILNYIQARTLKKVVITCGHRCPEHNAYADMHGMAKTSKHMIGAEVDFYVAGLEMNPEVVLELIVRFFRENAHYRGRAEYEQFTSLKAAESWANKEIAVRFFSKEEGRDDDNRHPYPYFCIEVLRDRDTKSKVLYTWPQAHRGIHRY